MTTIDYSSFLTDTGTWAGNFDAPPVHYGEYKNIATDVVGVQRPSGIITFDNLPVDLKIVSGNSLDLPFDKIYVDIDGYNDYVMMDAEQDGSYNGTGEFSSFGASYTSGGFWLLGDLYGNTPSVIFMATGNAPTGTTDILNLQWENLPSENFEASMGTLELNSNSVIVCTNDESFIGAYRLGYIHFDKNEYNWQKKIYYPLSWGFNYIIAENTDLVIFGNDSTNTEKTITLAYNDLVPDAAAIAIWWDGDDLHADIFTYDDLANQTAFIDAPAPFDMSIIIPSTYAEYISATIYADEPMISYDVINDNTIQITSDINNVISPLRKLYLNFSGITP